MKTFLDDDFLLTTKTAERLFHDYAEKMPIIDYHCHINPREIAENRRFENITQLWLGGDHYKWRLMRTCGVDERFITGDAPDREKFQKWAQTLEVAIGNPLYHWSHLELRRFFGYDGVLNSKTADKVWTLCNEKLAQPDFSVRGLILRSNVETVCTTDDPIDTLEWHKAIAADTSFDVKVLPAWRPDKAMNLEKSTFAGYIAELSKACGFDIASFSDLKKALTLRMDYFAENGCKLSDHALEYVYCTPYTDEQVERSFKKRLHGESVTAEEICAYKTAFMRFCAECYTKRGWVMQLHYGTKRDNNTKMFEKLGADTGFDCINNYAPSMLTADFLDLLERENALPKTIIYSLNPFDNQAIDSIIGCFQGGSYGKLQHGSAWWFNDNKSGMREQLTSLANLGCLSTFVGMLTDSRSFLSYPRHEYFRRILCGLLGEWVEAGEFPEDYDVLSRIVGGISYENAKSYFDFR